MKWIKRIALVLLVIVVVLTLVGLALPTTYTASCSVVIDAPRENVHALVADLEQWPRWEPWTAADPTVSVTLGEQTTGVGAHQAWSDQNGGGELTFTAVDPEMGIVYDLLIMQKYACKGRVTYADHADGLEVTWAMDGDTGTPVIGGYFAKLMPTMIEPMFEDGLRRLKTAAEETSQENGVIDPGAAEASG